MRRPVSPGDFTLYSMLSEPSFSPDGRRLAFSVKRANLDEDGYDSDIYVADVRSGRSSPFTTGKKDSDPKWSPDGRSILFTSRRGLKKEDKGNALYVISADGGEARLLKRSEAGIDTPQWSPDSRSVYFLSAIGKKAKDDVKVIDRVTFWFNGLGFIYDRRKHLFRVDLDSGKVSQITSGSIDVSDFALSHDGRSIAFVASSDDLRPYISDLYLSDARGKERRKLTRSNMELTTVAWSPDDALLALSGDDLPSGFASHSRIWTVDPRNGRVERIDDVDLNKANGLNSDVRAHAHGPGNLVWDKDGIYYLEAAGGAVRLCRKKVGGTPAVVVGGDRSVEGYDVHDGTVAFVAMDASHLEELFVSASGERRLTSLNSEVYKDLKVLSPQHVSFRASDGEEVEGWVMVPEGKKVPGILYVHGGPKTAFGHSYMHEFQAFAGAGYAVIYLNPRGSDGYSEKFADIRGKYGTRDYDDLMEGLDHVLKRFPQIDGERLAIAGGSYGGFMTNWAIGHTTRFRAAVTDRSIASWISFWGTSDIGPHFTEDQVGGDPWDSEEKLLSDSPLRYVPNVETPLMLVHSMEDYRCWMVEGLEFFTALKKHGKEAELVLFPGENHDLSRVGKPKHRVARLRHYIRWFDAHLKRKK
ncbi:MAG: S9 family peptidase [Nitrososphaerota archaeon]|nr:S9 family peptidase [Nitrososphaerota archaeon]MDG7022911.1 S9 family peptidase [Nitrososphaerota archaeon]